jgi:hypothetical protein
MPIQHECTTRGGPRLPPPTPRRRNSTVEPRYHDSIHNCLLCFSLTTENVLVNSISKESHMSPQACQLMTTESSEYKPQTRPPCPPTSCHGYPQDCQRLSHSQWHCDTVALAQCAACAALALATASAEPLFLPPPGRGSQAPDESLRRHGPRHLPNVTVRDVRPSSTDCQCQLSAC